MTSAVAPLPSQRHHFPMPEDITYFNCAYLSPQAESVTQAGHAALMRKANPWDVHPHHFYDESERVRAEFAKIIRAQAQDIAIIPSVSYGIGVAAKNMPLSAGQKVLVLQDQFPSNYYPWVARAKEVGAEMKVVARPSDGNWTTAILNALDRSVAVVALPNCHWTDGSLIDLETIGPLCRERGIFLVVDATQSLGVFPFDINLVQPAFLAVAGYKWLLGPYSVGFLYVAPEHQMGQPIEYNWITREGSENFARLVDYTDALMPDASRFDMGERSNFCLMPMSLAALQLINNWGVANISATLGAFNRELAAGAAELGFQTAPEHLRVPHLMGIRHPDGLPQSLAAQLRERKIHVSVRGDAIRVSPYLYNTPTERDHFLETLRELL